MNYWPQASSENRQINTSNEFNVQGMNSMSIGLDNMDLFQTEDLQHMSIAVPSSIENSYHPQGRQPLHQAAGNEHVSVVNTLLDAGADVNIVDEDGMSPLHFAASVGNASIVSALLAKNADVSAQEYGSSWRPIHSAADSGRLDVVQLLLEKGASADAVTIEGETPLFTAAEGGHVQVVERLLKDTTLVQAFTWEKGHQAIHMAAQGGYLKIVDLLIGAGADVNEESFNGSTPLALAAHKGSLPVVSYLLRKKAKVDVVYGKTSRCAIHRAARRGHEKVVRAFHSNSANLDPEALDGITPLWLAACHGHLSTLRFLLSHGANPNTINKDTGLSALHVAIKKGEEACADLLISHGADVHNVARNGKTTLWHACDQSMPVLVQILLEQGVDPNQSDRETGQSALHQAARSGDSEMVKTLITHSANINAITKDSVTPLSIAAEDGHKDIVKVFLNAKADVNIPSSCSRHAIHQAAEEGHVEIVKMLLPYVKNIDVTDENGCSPFWFAAQSGSEKIVSLLLDHDANINLANTQTGRLAIHEAAEEGHLEVIELIASKDPNVDRQAKDGVTPLWLGTSQNHQRLTTLLLQYDVNVNVTDRDTGLRILHHASKNGNMEIFESLLERNPDPDPSDHGGVTPLMAAARNGHRDIVEALILRGADKSARKKSSGAQAIHQAATHGYLDVVKLLVDKGDHVDVVNEDNVTPLMLAAQKGHTHVVQYLLEQHASINNARNGSGIRAIHQAAQGGHYHIVEMLLNNGAEYDVPAAGGETALLLAAEHGSNDIVSLLLQKNVRQRHDNHIAEMV
ncbi:MAG: hypothetical protein Q9217_000808 [Psora testacea]